MELVEEVEDDDAKGGRPVGIEVRERQGWAEPGQERRAKERWFWTRQGSRLSITKERRREG